MIRVITDSTSSIPRSLREEYGIELFSLFVNHDGKEYEERSMDLDEFYADIYEMADNIPTSSQPALSENRARLRRRGESGRRCLGRVFEQQDVGHVRKRRTRRERRRRKARVVSLRRHRQPYQLHGAGVGRSSPRLRLRHRAWDCTNAPSMCASVCGALVSSLLLNRFVSLRRAAESAGRRRCLETPCASRPFSP